MNKCQRYCDSCEKFYDVDFMDSKCPLCGDHPDHSEGLNFLDDLEGLKSEMRKMW